MFSWRKCIKITADNDIFVEVMEPRVLLSADALGVDFSVLDRDGQHQADWDQTVAADWWGPQPIDPVDTDSGSGDAYTTPGDLVAPALQALSENGAGPESESLDATDLLSSLDNSQALYREIIFLDTGVANGEQLLSDLLRDADPATTQVYLIDSATDGVGQITTALNAHRDLDAVHIISHGAAGQVQLGSSTLSSSNVDSYDDQLNDWGAALAESGDILIYGCDLANDAEGQALVDVISTLTGADVAASVDQTGNAEQGGNWELEYQMGAVETAAFASSGPQAWSGVLATIIVDTVDDDLSDGGDTSSVANLINTPGSNGISLREAIIAANQDVDIDTIDLKSMGAETFYIQIGGSGEDFSASGDFDILHDLIITGAGQGDTIINGGGLDRIFDIQSGDVTIQDLTIRDGNSGGGSGGGVVLNAGATANLSNLDVQGNTTTAGGGGIFSVGTLTIDNVSVDGNTAKWGAGINLDGGSATIEQSTISNNTSSNNGGGIYNFGAAGASLTNVTISGNDSSTNSGDGLWTRTAMTATNVTIAHNSGVSGGEGIHVLGGSTIVTLSNSILHNPDGVNASGSLTSGGFNIDSDGTAGLSGSGDQIVDPLLDSNLNDNGGPTRTHALLTGSAAIDSANLSGTPSIDQRGMLRDGLADIGAFEFGATANAAPAAMGDNYRAPANTTLSIIAASGLLANDTDSDTDPLSAYVVTGPGSGVLGIAPIGTINESNLTNDVGSDQQAMFSPDGSKIAFKSDRNGGTEIFTMNADGSGVFQVTFDGAVAGSPSWSPDGSKLTFFSNQDGDYEIYSINADGTGLAQLTTNGVADDREPNWSPDGTKIVFRSDQDGDNEIYVMDADGTNQVRLTTDAGIDNNPNWSPDGSQIVFTTNRDGNFNIYTMAADGSNLNRVTSDTGNDRAPRFSPDGSRIAFNSDRDGDNEIIVIDTDGSNVIQLTDSIFNDAGPSWSADGTQLVFETTRDGDSEIYVADLLFDGSFTYTPDNGFSGIDTFTYLANDGSLDSNLATATIELNTPPTATNLSSTTSYTEGAASVAIIDIVVTDVDSAEMLTATLTLANIAAGSLSATDGASYTAGTGIWTMTGTVADVNTALTNLVFNPATNNDLDTSIAVSVDDGDEDASGALTGTITLDVIPASYADLLLSSNGLAEDNNTTTFGANDIALFDNPDFELGDGTTGITDGTFSIADSFPENVRAVHYVGTEVTVDTRVGGVSGSYNLQVGQIVLSMRADDSSIITLPTIGAGTIAVNNTDLLVYSPDTGEYEILLQDAIFKSNGSTPANIHAITIVEQNTSIGSGTTLSAGTYILAASDPDIHSNIQTYNDTDRQLDLLLGVDFLGDGSEQIQGIELVENTVSLNGTVLNAGALLVSFTTNNNDPIIVGTVGGTTVSANQTDIVALTVNSTQQDTGAVTDVNAQILFDGSDIGLTIDDSGLPGEINGLALVGDASASNTAPTANNLNSANAYAEGATSVEIADIVVLDDDIGEFIAATLTLANIETGYLSATDGASYNSATGVWAVSGSVAEVNTALANLVFIPTSNNDVDTTISVSIDDGDEDTSGALTGTITLEVTPVNDAPAATNLNSTSAYTEGDASVLIIDIVVSDVDTGEEITATLTLANTAAGSLSETDGAIYTVGTGIWTKTGTVAEVNAALANLVFNPAANNDVDTTISVSIDDGNEDASAALNGTITLEVTPVNDAPAATNLTSTSLYTEGDSSVLITDIVVSDVDTGEEITATLTLANIAAGSLSATDGASYTVGTGIWTKTGTVAEVNTALANLEFNPAANNDVDTTINVSIDDGNEDASAALNGTITLDVTPVNDAPAATNLTSTSAYTEGNASVLITDIVVSDVDTGEEITATLTVANTAAGSLSETDGASYTVGTGIWTKTGTVADVNAALANLEFNPAANNDVDTTISVSIDDGNEDASAALNGTITLDVTPVNDAPAATNLTSTSAYTEGDASVLITTDIVVSDVDTAEQITATLTLANTAAGSLSETDGASYTVGTGIWTRTGTVAEVNTALANLEFNPAANNDVDTTISVSIDDGNEDASAALNGTITLDVTPVNDAPAATNLTSTSLYTEGDASVLITDIVVSDVDTGEEITATLTLADTAAGSLSETDGASYTVGTGIWTKTGTVAEVNAALANLEFNPAANNDVDTTISVSIDDGNEDASGALNGTITLDVTPVNDAPAATNLTSTSAYTEGDASVLITDIVVSDVDTGEEITATLTLANTAAGSLSETDGASYAVGTGIWTKTGTVADVNAALANLVFIPTSNNDVDTTISVSIDDGDEDTSGALTGTITLEVTPVNDAPAATNLNSTSAYTEGDASVLIIDIVVSDVDTGEEITATLTLANTAAGSLSETDGASYAVGTGIWTKTGTVAEVNTALAGLVFSPMTDNDVDTTISVSIDDGDEDTSGALTGTITLEVTPVNDAPAATNLSSTSAYTEGDASVLITDIVVSDVDTGEVITATLTLADTAAGSLSETDGASYAVGTGIWTKTGTVAEVNAALANLEFNPVANNDVDTTISVSIDDGNEDASGALTGTITLEVTPVNDAPAATNLSSTSAYTEGDASVLITDIVVSDVDTGEEITATLTLANIAAGSLSETDGASYTVGTGIWTKTGTVADVNAALANLVFIPTSNNDIDTTISVSIDDGDEDASAALNGTITLEVTPVNDAPAATNLTSTSLYTEGDASVLITDIVVSDVDTGEEITATLTLADTAAGSLSETDGASYTVGTGIWTKTGTVAEVNAALANLEFNPAANNDVDTTISVSIDDGNEDASGALNGTITLDVTPVNDAPAATNLTSTSAYTEGDASVLITDIVVSDVDTGEEITATLTLANTAAGSLSETDGASYAVGTGIWTKTGTVADVNAALANLVFIPTSNNDVDTTISVSIDDGDEDTSGALTGTITLEVTPVNDAPAATNLNSTSAYTEGDASVLIIDIVVSDVDTGEEITATLTLANTAAGSLSETDGASYAVGTGIWTKTGAVAEVNTALANLEFNPVANNDVDTTISVSIDDGNEDASGALNGTITLDVTPVNDAPAATNLTSTSAYTEGDASVLITDIVVSDVDTGEEITATLTLANTAAGSLSATGGASYTVGTGVWSMSGTVADVNAALANLEFNPAANNDVDTTISVSIDDGDEDTSGALTGTITLEVTPVNDAPAATNLTSTSLYTEGDSSVLITDIVVSDVDKGEVITATMTLADTAAGSLSATDGASYTVGTGIWTKTGTVAEVNAALAGLVFSPMTDNDVDTTISVSIEDGDEDTSAALNGTITLDVTPVNDAPAATNLTSTSAYTEGDASVLITDIVVSDVDTAEQITATLTLANTAAGSLSATDGASYTVGTGIWTKTGTVAEVNTALANLEFNPAANNDVDTTISVSIDDGNEDASGALTGTITLEVTPVNDAPAATNLSSTSAYTEGEASVLITDIVVSDVDTAEQITATLTVANTAAGSLSATDGASYIVGTGIWTKTGTVAEVNAALANLEFNPVANNDIDTMISVSIDDGNEDASAALNGTITLEVTPVNDVPHSSAGGSYTISEGDDLTLDASSSNDSDGSIIQYKWDLNNDLNYDDFISVTDSPTITWNTLVSMGLDDGDVGGRNHTIGLQVIDDLGATHESTTTLIIENVAPTLTTTGTGSVIVGNSYTLSLSAVDPGNDVITSWTINWGDGEIQAFAGNPSSVSHTYTEVGFTYNILASAIDKDGTHLQNEIPAHQVTVVGLSISGTVYEDIDGDGDVLDDGTGSDGVDVGLYLDDGTVAGQIDAADSFVTSGVTDGSGNYVFTGLSNATYWVVVDSATIDPNAGFNAGYLSGEAWAEQTFGGAGSVSYTGNYSYSASAGAFYGGMQSENSDNATALTSAQHVTRVIVSGSNVSSVDAGFSFNVISNTGDDGVASGSSIQGSLRQFLFNSNSIDNTLHGMNSSQFTIPTSDSNYNLSGNGEFRIMSIAALPTITDSVLLDATTQTGFVATPVVQLDGSVAIGVVDGLVLNEGSDGSTIMGLSITGFNDVGSLGAIVVYSDNSLITGNYLGLHTDGTTPDGNHGGINIIGGASNTIGGTLTGAGNLIAHNTGPGVQVVGVVSTGNAILGNSIHSNSGIGIDLLSGNSSRQSVNMDSVVTNSGSSVTIAGSYGDATLSLEPLRVEYFKNSGSAQEESTFLGFVDFVTDRSGNASINHILSANVDIGDYITATITDSNGNTSEFSFSLQVDAPVSNMEQEVAINAGATVAEGSMGNTVTAAMLNTTDVDNTAVETVYTVTAVPQSGFINLNGIALVENDTFTQDDIDNSRITYDHDGSETTSDNIDFSVDDSVGAVSTDTFAWTVTPENDVPRLLNPIADQIATEGIAFNFQLPEATFHDIDNDDRLTYSVSQVGTSQLPLWLRFDPVSQTFSGTPLNSDSGTLSIRVVAIDDSMASVAYDFRLFVSAVNDSPVLTENWMVLSSGDTVILTGDMLSYSDIDNDDEDLVFMVSAVSGGQFELNTEPGTSISDFTHTQLIAGNVVFFDDGDEVAPSYNVTVSDGTSNQGPVFADVSFTYIPPQLAAGVPPRTDLSESITDFPIDSSSVVGLSPQSIAASTDDEFSSLFTTIQSAGIPPEEVVDDSMSDIEASSGDELTDDSLTASDDIAYLPVSENSKGSSEAVSSEQINFMIKMLQSVAVPGLLTASFELDQLSLEIGNLLSSYEFTESLDDIRKDSDSSKLFRQVTVASSVAVTTGLSVGYVAWMVRGGVLLSSVLSSLPAWQFIDPLPVLNYADESEEGGEQDDSLEDIITDRSEAGSDVEKDLANDSENSQSTSGSKESDQ
ncbi:DUF4347 domain-containing protein [Granulosicoccus antarcticus]|uniref:Dipeptidyl-peptidase 5 n=1 Tax=Granulosicoccus antarcticus IMCC3135 TaxID=1192854 RepID=A0A2Z2NXS6_9GAMM|nr:DUF4347 domain-containing protein [Granulosicoccus antarcticus]ASJ75285.1 Dipeptidyl-peptidase 5 [Granulosicoccus antarcticus IMCC3135]